MCGFLEALVEGRGQAKGEIGLASVDLRRPVLILCQVKYLWNRPHIIYDKMYIYYILLKFQI